MDSIDLKFISAYWCKAVSPQYVESFTWAWERAEETVMEIGEPARDLLVCLAESAPDDRAASYLAAGPFESYVNLIVRESDADEAAFVTGNRILKGLLPHVWGERKKLESLSKTSSNTILFHELHLEEELKTLGIGELMGFWCRISGSSAAAEYDGLYNQVLKKLLNKKSRDAAVHDITISSPDEGLLKYVKENVFVLQG